MPYYTYECLDCGTHFEKFSSIDERLKQKVCPFCHKENSKKLIDAPNIDPFIFEHTIDGTKRGNENDSRA